VNEPSWLSVARAFVGILEIPGPQSNPVILQWGRELKAPDFTNDDTAWCAVFMNRLCMACQLPVSGTGFDLLRAKSFLSWGQHMPAPAMGSFMVFERPQGFHVALYAGERQDAYFVLGGNQGNAVSYTWIEKTRLVGCRWPAAVAMPLQQPPTLLADNGQPLSVNEA
jgi:uncharacterized protein (TIGR02594 family)